MVPVGMATSDRQPSLHVLPADDETCFCRGLITGIAPNPEAAAGGLRLLGERQRRETLADHSAHHGIAAPTSSESQTAFDSPVTTPKGAGDLTPLRSGFRLYQSDGRWADHDRDAPADPLQMTDQILTLAAPGFDDFTRRLFQRGAFFIIFTRLIKYPMNVTLLISQAPEATAFVIPVVSPFCGREPPARLRGAHCAPRLRSSPLVHDQVMRYPDAHLIDLSACPLSLHVDLTKISRSRLPHDRPLVHSNVFGTSCRSFYRETSVDLPFARGMPWRRHSSTILTPAVSDVQQHHGKRRISGE